MWFLFALASAFLYAFRGILEKTAVTHINKYVLGLGIRLFALPFFIIPFLIQPELFIPPQDLPGSFWIAVLFVSIIGTPLETIFYYEAIKKEELSLALPILSLSPVLTIGFAALVFGELPSLLGAIGIVVILLGVYALKISHAREGLLEPLKHLAKSRGVQFMAIVACSLALGSIFDKMGVKASNVYMYALFNYASVSISLWLFAHKKAPHHLHQLGKNAGLFIRIGLIVAGYTLLYLLALNEGPTAYVVAIRNASVLLTIVLGVLLFKERDLVTKIIAGALIFAGLVLIKVFSS